MVKGAYSEMGKRFKEFVGSGGAAGSVEAFKRLVKFHLTRPLLSFFVCCILAGRTRESRSADGRRKKCRVAAFFFHSSKCLTLFSFWETPPIFMKISSLPPFHIFFLYLQAFQSLQILQRVLLDRVQLIVGQTPVEKVKKWKREKFFFKELTKCGDL